MKRYSFSEHDNDDGSIAIHVFIKSLSREENNRLYKFIQELVEGEES